MPRTLGIFHSLLTHPRSPELIRERPNIQSTGKAPSPFPSQLCRSPEQSPEAAGPSSLPPTASASLLPREPALARKQQPRASVPLQLTQSWAPRAPCAQQAPHPETGLCTALLFNPFPPKQRIPPTFPCGWALPQEQQGVSLAEIPLVAKTNPWWCSPPRATLMAFGLSWQVLQLPKGQETESHRGGRTRLWHFPGPCCTNGRLWLRSRCWSSQNPYLHTLREATRHHWKVFYLILRGWIFSLIQSINREQHITKTRFNRDRENRQASFHLPHLFLTRSK